MIGSSLSHFRITAKLGEGGMGEVYRAEDTKLGREVAIKVLPAEMAGDPERLERFQREARALAALDHPNIVSVFSVESTTREGKSPSPTEPESIHFLVMGLVEGQTLEQKIPTGGLPLDQLLDLAVPMTKALAAAHAKGITHRDLKPQNVMVTDDGQIKVLDFGLAKLTEEASSPDSTQLPTELFTREGLVVGTPSYMSPEQATGDLVDPRSDVFSLGILLYEMATGVRPFQGDRPAELVSSILTDSPRPATELNPSVPSSLNRLILRCLEKRPENRYPSAAEVVSELRNLDRGTDPVPSEIDGQVGSRFLKAIAVVLGVLALVAAAWWTASRFTSRGTSSVGTRKLAVLPFEDLSRGEDQSWFADGVHEALLTTLQQIEGLRVTSRTSAMRYRDSDMLLGEIASQLGVRWLVEGSVVQAGDRVRITAQLLDGEKDEPVWAEQYERDFQDVLALQGDIARAIADEIRVSLTPADDQRLAESRQVDPEVFRAYTLGLRHFDRITPADFLRSVEYFQQAIDSDPAFPQPHAALAIAYGIAIEYGWISREQAGPLARRAAQEAMRLDPDSGAAHHAMASVEFHVDRDFAVAERSYQQALKLTSDAYIHFGYGWLLSQMGRHTDAVMALEEAVDLDPRSALIRSDLGWWLYGDRQFDRAIDEARFAIELDPSISEPYWLLAATYAQQGRFDEALNEFDRYESLYGEPVYWFRGYLHALAGQRERALQDLAKLEGRVARGESPSIELAQIHLGLGDREHLLETLEDAEESGVSFQPYLWPEYETYYNEPRFQAVMQRFSLPLPPQEVDR